MRSCNFSNGVKVKLNRPGGIHTKMNSNGEKPDSAGNHTCYHIAGKSLRSIPSLK